MSRRPGAPNGVESRGAEAARLSHVLSVGLAQKAVISDLPPAAESISAGKPSKRPMTAKNVMIMDKLTEAWGPVVSENPHIMHWAVPKANVQTLTKFPTAILAMEMSRKDFQSIVDSDDGGRAEFGQSYTLDTNAGLVFELTVTPKTYHLRAREVDQYIGMIPQSAESEQKPHATIHEHGDKDIQGDLTYKDFLVRVKTEMEDLLREMRAKIGVTQSLRKR